jgi:hypothetical protein
MDQKTIDKHKAKCDIVRARLPEGPWQTEPDRVNWKHKGLDCLMVRNDNFLHWCGYVGIPKSHPFYGKDYNDVPVDVHGGLTYGKTCDNFVCHIPEKGSDDDIYWLGFDCAHYGDLAPGMSFAFPSSMSDDQYRDLEYVKKEVENLAELLAEAA